MESKKILGLNIEKNLKTKNRIIISLTTIPPRFLSENFDKVIDSLKNQILKAEIVLNIPKNYKRKFEYSEKLLNNKIELLKNQGIIVNIIEEDLGPITKILGLLNLELNDRDIIISLDDDFEINSKMTYFHLLCYKIYKCDCIFIPETLRGNETQIFYNNYFGSCFGYHTFSFRFKFVKELYTFYNEVIKLDRDLWRHDDLIISIFYKVKNLNACCININFQQKNLLHFKHGLHTIPCELAIRRKLHLKIYDIFKPKQIFVKNNTNFFYLFNNNVKIILTSGACKFYEDLSVSKLT